MSTEDTPPKIDYDPFGCRCRSEAGCPECNPAFDVKPSKLVLRKKPVRAVKPRRKKR